MDDQQIIALYWQRSELAIGQSEQKYGPYCRSIAHNILACREDEEECVNDTWLRAWDAMPPHKPTKLAAFLGKITRNLALNRREKQSAQKRGGGQVELALEELTECVPGGQSPEHVIDDLALKNLLNRFLRELNPQARTIFLRRYWYLCPVKDIARMDNLTQSKVKMTLLRSRARLREMLEEEGFCL